MAVQGFVTKNENACLGRRLQNLSLHFMLHSSSLKSLVELQNYFNKPSRWVHVWWRNGKIKHGDGLFKKWIWHYLLFSLNMRYLGETKSGQWSKISDKHITQINQAAFIMPATIRVSPIHVSDTFGQGFQWHFYWHRSLFERMILKSERIYSR